MNVYGAFKCNFSQTHRCTPQKERGSVCECVSGGLEKRGPLCFPSHGYPVSEFGLVAGRLEIKKRKEKKKQSRAWLTGAQIYI